MRLLIVVVAAFVLVTAAAASSGVRTAERRVMARPRPQGQPVGRYLLQTRGIWSYFEDLHASDHRAWAPGQLIQQFGDPSVRREIALQLDHMHAMGVNEISFDLRSSDPQPEPSTPPSCNVPSWEGLQWPNPTHTELTNLGRFLDFAQSKGVRVAVMLNNTHMEEQPPTNSERWLGSILGVLKDKPALDYVAFGGDEHLLDLNGDGIKESCGGVSEAPLWLGASGVGSRYVAWAIRYGMSLGLPARKLTAEAIVGDFEDLLGNGERGFWRPILVLKQIFDELGMPQDQRTYALSFYEHRKCALPNWLPITCDDSSPDSWAATTIRDVVDIVGQGARLTAPEWGYRTPVESSWSTAKAVESLGVLFQRYAVDGGTFWKWIDNGPWEVTDHTLADPVKIAGAGFSYNPVQRELADLYGFHLAAVANGSFEHGLSPWSISKHGTATLAPLDETDVRWRGSTFLRLTATGTASATSPAINISPSTTYTTTANLRFSWTDDPRPKAKPTKRPQVDVAFRYLTCAGRPSRLRMQKIYRYYQENATKGFETFPLGYTTPKDACYVQIQFIAASKTLGHSLAVDIDNVR